MGDKRGHLLRTLLRVFPRRLLSDIRWELRATQVTYSYMLPAKRKQLSRVRQLARLKVSIGCGQYKPDGWLGLDWTPGPTVDLRWDIRRGLPFADGSCRFLFSEHVFEHLNLEELRRLLLDCFRVLEPGGALRIVVPDLERYVRAYLEKDTAFIRSIWQPTNATPTEMINGLFYLPTHQFMHDYESMSKEVILAGFDTVYRSSQRCSKFEELNIDSDFPHRGLESLYIEAQKGS